MEQTQEAPFAASATTTTTSSLPLPMGPNLVGDQRGERNDGGGGGGDVVAVRRAAAVSVDDGITLHVPLAPTIATTPHYDTAHSNNNTNNSASGEVPRALPATGIGHDHHTHAPIPSLTLSSPHPAADASTIPMVTPIRSRKSKLAGPTSGALQRAFDAFHQHDQDHDHLISRNELLAVLHDAGLDIDETDVHDILRLVDLEGTGDLDFEEFYSLYVGLEIFNRLKKDTRSVMKKRELKQLLRMYGLDTDEKKLHKMMKLVGVEAGGIVHFDDFLRIYVKVHHQHHKNVDLLEHAVRHWYSGSGHGTILAIENLSPVQDMIAGTCAGVSITLVGHPFDTVKVRIQTAEKGMFAGPIDATLKTIRGEGVRLTYHTTKTYTTTATHNNIQHTLSKYIAPRFVQGYGIALSHHPSDQRDSVRILRVGQVLVHRPGKPEQAAHSAAARLRGRFRWDREQRRGVTRGADKDPTADPVRQPGQRQRRDATPARVWTARVLVGQNSGGRS
eukprot:TRINITY_DN5027_c0_g1_i2.p1 TRINITY_DN5027_c0_g1~~TRINITY_DN5027_c0_g1_i2.p1  ORF type:complete len:503 (+),score=66.00 TRINITY_DN5027_c0_g1_i2:80-1588(+)